MFRLTATSLRLTQALRAAVALVLLFAAGWAQAVPSACGALWATAGSNLNYWNATASSWVTAAVTPVAGPNALSGYEGDGALYFASQVGAAGASMYKATLSNTTGSITFAQMAGGTIIQTPPSFTYTQTSGTTATSTIQFFVGATLDRDTSNRRMFILGTRNSVTNIPINGTSTTSGPLVNIGLLDPESPGSVSWTTVYQTTGTGTVTYPLVNTSGDIFADQQTGAIWLVTNTNPVRFLKLSLNYTGYTINSAQVVQTATVAGLSAAYGIAAVAVDPFSGSVYVGSAAAPIETYRITDHTAAPTVNSTLVQSGTAVGDAGNCVAPPDPPTVTKSFSPTTATSPGTSVLTITINNPNKTPIYLTQALTDAFPSGMAISTTPALSASCFSDGASATRPASATITGVAGATSTAVVSGSQIPGGATSGGSCSFSVQVSATVAAFYNNTIPAGSLSTSVGTNAAQAAATFQVQNVSLPNAPTISKSFAQTTSSATVGTTTLTIVITNPNTITNTLTAALIDVLPTNMKIGNPVSRAVTCFSDGVATTRSALTTITGTINLGTATIPSGAVIPGGVTAGSCSFSIVVSQTVAALSANSIPAGSLTMVSGSNAAAATASYYLRASDFSVVKSQREGTTGVTTTAQLDVASGQTISYIIRIVNGGGVSGTRTFTDTLPVLITPTLSLGTSTFGGATGCRAITTTVAGPPASTRISGTITGAPVGGGCEITVVAKASVTAVIGTATNSVGIYTVTGALDTNTADNTATVVLVIKPAANLSITKDDGKTVLVTGSTNAYTITVANGGPASADGAVLKDPAATGLDCTDISCSAAGGASCPLPAQLFVSALQSGTGLAIPTFPSGGTVTFVLTCTVTATGEP